MYEMVVKWMIVGIDEIVMFDVLFGIVKFEIG